MGVFFLVQFTVRGVDDLCWSPWNREINFNFWSGNCDLNNKIVLIAIYHPISDEVSSSDDRCTATGLFETDDWYANFLCAHVQMVYRFLESARQGRLILVLRNDVLVSVYYAEYVT